MTPLNIRISEPNLEWFIVNLRKTIEQIIFMKEDRPSDLKRLIFEKRLIKLIILNVINQMKLMIFIVYIRVN